MQRCHNNTAQTTCDKTAMINEALFIATLLGCFAIIIGATRLGKIWLYVTPPVFLVLVNTFTPTLIPAFGVTSSLGVAMYAAIFLATDIIAEIYGKQEAQKVVWMGFASLLALLGISQLTALVTPVESAVVIYEATNTLFSLSPRFVAASLLAYVISQQWDIHIFHKLKKKYKGKKLWLRNNVSTITSQFIDSFIVIYVAFWGVFPGLFGFAMSVWITKIVIAALDTPIIYWTKKILKE